MMHAISEYYLMNTCPIVTAAIAISTKNMYATVRKDSNVFHIMIVLLGDEMLLYYIDDNG